ncbi:MAG: flagellar biosynthetic protein FliR [Nitrospina sp.]|nr:flagellar biosynthetic protein FliR [Nitrospina sp.]
MGIIDLSPAEYEKFMFVLLRVGALIMFIPILGSPQVPKRIKVGFILFISIAVFPMVRSNPMHDPKGLFELVIALFSEITIGLAVAYSARLIFTAVQVAGTIVDFQMGFGVVNVIDPQTETQVSITAQFQNILTILIFLALDAHHIIIGAIVESFFLINPSQINFSTFTPEIILLLFKATFVTAVKIAAPIMAILFFISVGLGLVARTVPQMNVFIVGFPLQIGVGLLMVGLSMSFFSIVVQGQIEQLPERFLGIMQSFKS